MKKVKCLLLASILLLASTGGWATQMDRSSLGSAQLHGIVSDGPGNGGGY